MKRRGFLGLLLSAPLAAKVAAEPKAKPPAIEWRAGPGNTAPPAISFNSDTNTGVYWGSAGGLLVSGSDIAGQLWSEKFAEVLRKDVRLQLLGLK